MAIAQQKFTVCSCERCGHEWQPTSEVRGAKLTGNPNMCPKCKSLLWNVPPISKGRKQKGN